MPYLEDGTPVDVVLNPLGVPSRMNVGQVLETHLGWAAKGVGQRLGQMYDLWVEKQQEVSDQIRDILRKTYHNASYLKIIDEMTSEDLLELARKVRNGVHTATPVFDGAKEEDIRGMLSESGRGIQSILFDGRTGEAFAEDVTVGVMYVLKLHHLVDDKIHARSIDRSLAGLAKRFFRGRLRIGTIFCIDGRKGHCFFERFNLWGFQSSFCARFVYKHAPVFGKTNDLAIVEVCGTRDSEFTVSLQGVTGNSRRTGCVEILPIQSRFG